MINTILALDLGTTTGWALRPQNGQTAHGFVSFKSQRFEGGEAHAFPLGTVDTFSTYYAPADFNETANTLGQALYAKQEPRKFERGTDLHTQSNPLPMCHRPGVLVKLTMA